MSNVLYEKVLSEDYEKGKQLRLVVNEFRGNQYLHIRIYYLTYEGEWVPSKDGVSMQASIASIYSLLDGLIDICSHEESLDSISQHFGNRINELKQVV